MRHGIFEAPRKERAKRAFSTRRVVMDDMRTIVSGNLRPKAGDLLLARVVELGKQTRLELTDGRRAYIFPGDEIIVAYGNRYAPDQYEAVVAADLGPCDLVAAGGVAGLELSRHQRMLPPTSIEPVGLIGDGDGIPLNLSRYRIDAPETLPRIPGILSLGTSMNAGKTLTAASMVRGLKRLGHRVAALKITGTGSGGDLWIVRDAGAEFVADFTDAGFPSTYLTPVDEIVAGAYRLLNAAADHGCDVAVIEIADGLQQLETSALVRNGDIRAFTLATLFAAGDSMGAMCGVDVLRRAGHDLVGLSGKLGRSPLSVREAEAATGLRYFSPFEMQEGALVPELRRRASRSFHAMPHLQDALCRLAAEAVTTVGIAPGEAVSREGISQLVESGRVRMGAPERVRGAGREDDVAVAVLRRAAEHVMHGAVDALCGTEAPAGERANQRNGYRALSWATPMGEVELRVPRLRRGGYRPAFLDREVPEAELHEIVATAGTGAFATALGRLLAALAAPEAPEGDNDALEQSVLGIVVGAGLGRQPQLVRVPVRGLGVAGEESDADGWDFEDADDDDDDYREDEAPEAMEFVSLARRQGGDRDILWYRGERPAARGAGTGAPAATPKPLIAE